MTNPYTQYPLMKPGETFQFTCQKCAKCCTNVLCSVMIESLDLFRLAQHFQMDVADVANHYLEAVTIEGGAPVLILRTQGPDHACIFLKDNKCSIQNSGAKPRACRLYPLSVGPDGDLKKFLIFNVSGEKHHFKGRRFRAQEWVAANFSEEDRAYISTEYRAMREFGRIFRRIPKHREDDVVFQMLKWRYFMFETDQPFIRQFVRNMALLKRELEKTLAIRQRREGKQTLSRQKKSRRPMWHIKNQSTTAHVITAAN